MATLRRQVAFLGAYALTGVMATACEAAKVSRETVQRWGHEDATFEGLMRQAYEDARDRVEHELVRRAVDGVDKPVYYKGVKVDTVKEYSDTLLALLIKQRRPSFAQAEKTGGSTTNVSVNALVVPIERLSDEQFALLEQIYDKAGPPIQEVPVPGRKAIEGVVEVEGA